MEPGTSQVFSQEEIRALTYLESLSCGCVALRELCSEHTGKEYRGLKADWIFHGRNINPERPSVTWSTTATLGLPASGGRNFDVYGEVTLWMCVPAEALQGAW